MKQFYFYLACLLLCTTVQAAGDRTAIGDTNIHDGGIQFQFNSIAPSNRHQDSVLIIFDRCNHTGAGIIYQVYAADENHCVNIPAVPAGKYYVTIQCLGTHRDRLEKMVHIKAKKNHKIRITLEDSEEFSKDKVVIPAYHPDFANLAVLRTK